MMSDFKKTTDSSYKKPDISEEFLKSLNSCNYFCKLNPNKHDAVQETCEALKLSKRKMKKLMKEADLNIMVREKIKRKLGFLK